MDVIFYKTKLTRQNRCYGATEYDNYLNGCVKKVVTLSDDIVPNNPFYLVTDEGMWGYNYITYTYKGYLFGAFIDGIRIQALSNSTQIIHVTDNWYFALKNVGIDNMDFHGQCSRAHVNDIKQDGSNHYATLENTTNTPEEVFNTSNLIKYQHEPRFSYGQGDNLYWLHVYVANIGELTQFDDRYPQSISYPFGERKIVGNLGVTLTYPAIYGYSGLNELSILSLDESGTIKYCSLSELTQAFITSMIVTKIPPRNDISGMTESNPFSASYRNNIKTINVSKEYFPLPYNFFNLWQPASFKILPQSSYDYIIFKDDTLARLTTYEDFVKYGNNKIGTTVYNPIFIKNNYLNSLSCNRNDDFYIALTFDLSQTIIYNPSDNYEGIQSIFLTNNALVFASNSVNDYWTRLNALQTSLGGRITENNGAIQGVKQAGKMANQALGVVSNAAGAVGQILSGDVIGAIQGVAGLAQSGVNLGIDAATYEKQNEIYRSRERIGQYQQEIAQHQYESGTTTNGAVSYYGAPSCDESAVISGVSNYANWEQIGINLHRYGYNTFLQLDDIYFNHKRTNFNYFLCSECEVTGVPTDIAEDIQNMFQSGVHLWTGEVENFEVTNYQEGLTW